MDSTASSIVNTLGAGSGVNMAKLAADLSAARFMTQIQRLEARSETNELRISAAAALKSQLSQLASALGDRIRDGDLAPSASVANASVASASVAPGSKGGGTYTLEVSQLAQTQIFASKAYSAADALVGEGTMTLKFGELAGGSFAQNTQRAAVEITIGGSDTLADVANKINVSASGITAYVANGTSGAQLVLKGQEGAENGFVIETSGPGGGGLPLGGGAPAQGDINYLSWSPASDSGQLRQAAQDAAFTLDGVAMTSASNRATGLPAGLILTLGGTNTGQPTQVSFNAKDGAIKSLMSDFVAALNDITSQLKDSAAPLGGELGNDAGARLLKRSLATLSSQTIMPNAADGEPSTLADLGLSLNRDGSFTLDNSRLSKTLLENADGAAAMFTTGLYGVFATMDSLARKMGTAGDPGALGGSLARYEKQQQRIEDKLSDIAEQQAALRERMTSSFAAADRNVASSQSTLSFLKSQIAVWNAQSR